MGSKAFHGPWGDKSPYMIFQDYGYTTRAKQPISNKKKRMRNNGKIESGAPIGQASSILAIIDDALDGEIQWLFLTNRASWSERRT